LIEAPGVITMQTRSASETGDNALDALMNICASLHLLKSTIKDKMDAHACAAFFNRYVDFFNIVMRTRVRFRMSVEEILEYRFGLRGLNALFIASALGYTRDQPDFWQTVAASLSVQDVETIADAPGVFI
jgi:hypothetical protein